MRPSRYHVWTIFIAALVIRLLSLGAYPLMDTTEARYGEMARLMVETGNWLTPQFDYGVPFWGKPPLFTWMSATGIELMGINEFAVRVPHWVAGILVLVCVAWMAKKIGVSPLIACLVLATCAIFSVASGAVMTDMALTLGMTMAMVGFYLCWFQNGWFQNGEVTKSEVTTERDQPRWDEKKGRYRRKAWGYVGFIGLAIGLLAKGPLVLVLFGLAVIPWLILQHGLTGAFRVLRQRFPLVTGLILMCVIAVPWYVMAERATPGFLDYFIVGEHFKRFLISGWKGDLYGSAHQQPHGMIWLFWLSSAAPWSLVLPVLAWLKRATIKRVASEHQGVISFLVLWLLSPMILFSFSGNILPAYVLPGVPALGLLTAILLSDSDETTPRWFMMTASLVPILLIGAAVYLQFGLAERHSDKTLLEKSDPNIPTFYIGKRPFSGQFYSRGQAKRLKDDSLLADGQTVQLIGHESNVNAVVAGQHLTCVIVYTAKSHRGLYRCVR